MQEATTPIAFGAEMVSRAICYRVLLFWVAEVTCIVSFEYLSHTEKAIQASAETHQNQYSQWLSEPYQIE